MLPLQEIIAKCKGSGLKLTPQRLTIFKILQNNKNHPTAEMIYNVVKKKFPTISLTTVYNTLETLHNMGELNKLDIDYDRVHFDPDTSVHHHFICSKCHGIEDIHVDFNQVLDHPELKSNSKTIDQFNINFRGLCTKCQKKEH